MLDNLLEALGFVGNVLDTPAAMVRNAAAKRNPVSAIYDWQGRASGRDILTAWGAPENDPDRWELNDFLGAGLDLGIGALTPGLPLGLAARKMGLLGGAARGASMIDDAAAKLPGMADDAMGALPRNMSMVPAQQLPWMVDNAMPPWQPASDVAFEGGNQIAGLLPAPAGPFYSRLQRAIETLPDKPIKAESLVNMLKKAPGGVSNEEIKWMFPEQELLDGSPYVTKDQVRGWAQDMNLMPRTKTLVDYETMKVGDDGFGMPAETPEDWDAIFAKHGDRAKYVEYTSNHPSSYDAPITDDLVHDYKENLFKLPENFNDSYIEPHWREHGDNIFAHTRTSVRDLYGVSDSADPIRGVKFLDEYQSQLHQEGRKYGYAGDSLPQVKIGGTSSTTTLSLDVPGGKSPEWFITKGMDGSFIAQPDTNSSILFRGHTHRSFGDYSVMKTFNRKEDAVDYAKKMIEREAHEWSVQTRPPAAPFSEEWKDIALKHALYDAAASGSPGLGWSRGDQIAKLVGGPKGPMMKVYDEETPKRLSKLLKMKGEADPRHVMVGSKLDANDHGLSINSSGDGNLEVKWKPTSEHILSDVSHYGSASIRKNSDQTYSIVMPDGKAVFDETFPDPGSATAQLQSLIRDEIRQINKMDLNSASRYFNYMPISPEVRARILAEGFPLLSALGLGAGAIGLTQAGNAGDNPR